MHIWPAADCSRPRPPRGADFVLDLNETVDTLDSSAVDFFVSVFPWTTYRHHSRTATPYRPYVLGSIPSFIHVWNGKLDDVKKFDLLVHDPGAIYVITGPSQFKRLYPRVCSAPEDRSRRRLGRSDDHRGRLPSREGHPGRLRRLRCRDPDARNRRVVFSNHSGLDATTVCALDKSRWRIDLHSAENVKCGLVLERLVGRELDVTPLHRAGVDDMVEQVGGVWVVAEITLIAIV